MPSQVPLQFHRMLCLKYSEFRNRQYFCGHYGWLQPPPAHELQDGPDVPKLLGPRSHPPQVAVRGAGRRRPSFSTRLLCLSRCLEDRHTPHQVVDGLARYPVPGCLPRVRSSLLLQEKVC